MVAYNSLKTVSSILWEKDKVYFEVEARDGTEGYAVKRWIILMSEAESWNDKTFCCLEYTVRKAATVMCNYV